MKIEKTVVDPVYTLTLSKKDYEILLDIIGNASDHYIKQMVGHNNYSDWIMELYRLLDKS